MMVVVIFTGVFVNRNTYPKEGNVRIGYCGEIYLLYRFNF